jgi:hypothetical protein
VLLSIWPTKRKNKMNITHTKWQTLTFSRLELNRDKPSAHADKKFEPAQLWEDFKIARDSLEEAHSGLYRYTKKAELDRIFDETEKSLDHPMDFYEFYSVMALPIAAIKCGHTDVNLSPEIQKELKACRYFLRRKGAGIPRLYLPGFCPGRDLGGKGNSGA